MSVPLEHYALLAELHTGLLVSNTGSVDTIRRTPKGRARVTLVRAADALQTCGHSVTAAG